MRVVLACLSAFALTACAATPDPEPAFGPTPAPSDGKCDASALESFTGQTASAQTGAAILTASGARTLRWGPPRSAWTMDHREDRVNVRYDDNMAIIAVTCG